MQRETLSIKDISKIKKPIVWTLHDMWAFCGAEHYTTNNRWQEGYKLDNRPSYESGFDLNRWTWQRKKKYWKKQFQIVTPSKWLASCVNKSLLMKDWPVSVIPNPIDADFWKPIDKYTAKKKFNLPTDVPLILFGAVGGGKDPRKGYNLLISTLNYIKSNNQSKKIELIVFGQKKPIFLTDYKFPIHFLGHLNGKDLRDVYSAADLMVVPSKQDNLPNTAVEAQICGTPVVSFDIGGLVDIIDHKKTGYLAKAFNTKDFAEGISWVLQNNTQNQLSDQSREQALKNFSERKIAENYLNIYKNKIKQENKHKASQKIQISFIMPAYNSEQYIGDSIKELQKENEINWEIIIIDDFSKDKTYEIAKSFQEKDNRIKVFKNLKKGKVTGTNYGYSLSSGEIIKCIDSDDVLHKDYFKYFNQLLSYDAHCHNAFITNDNLNVIAKYSINPRLLSNNYNIVASELLSFPKWAWSFNRKIASNIFPMPENLPFEDIWINLIIKKHCKEIFYIKSPIYMYRQHDTQTFGGILNFDKQKVIFRANRMLKLINIIKLEPRIQDNLEKDIFRNIENYWKLMSLEELSYFNILKTKQKFIEKLKIILMKKIPFLPRYALYFKWRFDGLFKN